MSQNAIHTAVILVGGLGTRLRSVIGEFPKCMVDIGGKPFLEHLILRLKSQGVSKVVLCVGFQSHVVEDYFKDGDIHGVQIVYAHEKELLGTAGAIRNAEHLIGEKSFLVMNGDSFIDFDLATLGAEHFKHHADISILVTESEEKHRFGTLMVDDHGFIQGFYEKDSEKSHMNFINAGVYIVSWDILQNIPKNTVYSFEKELIPELIDMGRKIFACRSRNQLVDIGTPESLAYFSEHYRTFLPRTMRDDILHQIDESMKAKVAIREQCIPQIERVIDILVDAFQAGKKLLICGNGGSAADSQHIAAEFISSFRSTVQRPSLPAIALTTDTSILTAYSNDFGVNGLFARQVEGLGSEGDVLLAISTSGNSENVIQAVAMAKQKGMISLGLLGNTGGKLKDLVDHSIIIPAEDTPRIQEGHILAYHLICDFVEKRLFSSDSNHHRQRSLKSDTAHSLQKHLAKKS